MYLIINYIINYIYCHKNTPTGGVKKGPKMSPPAAQASEHPACAASPPHRSVIRIT